MSAASMPVVLLDEEQTIGHVEPDDVKFAVGRDEQREHILLEEYPQENGVYQIPVDEEGFVMFFAAGENPLTDET